MKLILFTLIILALAGCTLPKVIVREKEVWKHDLMEEEKDALTEHMDYHEKSELYYLFEYDDDNLYLNLVTFNQNLQRKISQFGFTVWIDRTGGKNREQGFRFPKGARIPGANSGRSINLSMMGYKTGPVDALLEKADEIDLIGIYGGSTRTVKMRDSRIRVNAERIENMLIYEAVIPYEVLKLGFNPLEEDSPISIGLETGYFEQARTDRLPDPNFGRSPRTGTMPRRGMAGQVPSVMPESGLTSRRSENMGELSRPTELWLELEFGF